MRRRDFITLLGGAVAAWPIAARAQQAGMPLVAFVSGRAQGESERHEAAFRKGLNGTGFIEGQNVTVEYHWLNGQYDKVPSLIPDLIRRHPAVLAMPSGTPAPIAAKAATSTLPIVFGVADDPVKLGLVASLARPGGNATGINFLTVELAAKRLGLLHELVPKASRIGVLVNPANATNAESTLRDAADAARTLQMQVQVLRAATIPEIDAAFAALVRERADALFVGPDAYLSSRRVQLATLAARFAMPTAFGSRDFVEAGGLMGYGTDVVDAYRQVGDYVGRILKGAKPADLPVLQPTKFELVLNLTTARMLGLAVPPDMLTIADEVIE
jgi:putative ABC transport system substrate-binding protein